MAGRHLSGRLVAGTAAVAVALALAWALRPRPVPVEVRTVRRGPLAVQVRDDGVTRIRERYLVTAPLAGTMRRVALHVGDAVEAGTTLVTAIEPADPTLLDPRARTEAAARVATARAALEYTEHAIHRAQVVERYAAADLGRARQLFPAKAVTREQLDAAERAWETAREEVEETERARDVARHVVTLMEAALVRATPGAAADGAGPGTADWRLDVHAPAGGRVLEVLREDAGPVEAGARLVVIGDPADLEVVVDLVSEDAVRVRPGDRCTITAWGGAAPLVGRVRVVEPRGFTKVSPLGVEEQRVNVIVDLDPPAAGRDSLGDDFRVEAAITVDAAEDVVLVPLAALFGHGAGTAVFVVDGGRARLVPVSIGRRGEHDAEVLSGLSGGERVVAYPADAVAADVPVTVTARH